MDTVAEKAKMREIVSLLLPDGLMIFLGLLMAPIVIIPLLTQSLPQPVVGFFNIADTTIIAIFVLEYVLKLVLAEDPAAHFLDRWHLLDLVIITLPFLEAVPIAGSTIARSSPTLRLLRVVRVAAAGGRSVERRIEPETTISGPARPVVSTMRIRGWVEGDGAGGREFSPAGVKEFLLDPTVEAWFDVSSVSRPDFPVLAELLSLPVAYFESRLMKASHPGVTVTGTTRLIFVQEPEQTLRIRKGVRVPVVTTTGLVIVDREKTIVTVSKAEDRIFEPILAGLAGNIREGLLSLIDVHINTVSYEMNRAMRVIAVLSALVLIPTLIGQVLGMNILGIPFALSLWEVTAWTIISMLVVGWIFYRLGWLR
ncbi:MAG: CorA family divalent cation transporter [Methanoculleus sp.]